MPDIEIKRGYEVLPDNNIRFGIKVINSSDYSISDVEVILDYNESLFNLKRDKIQKLGNIPPENIHTAEFILKPLGCIHKVNIEALISYRDPKWKKHVETMHPKEVHCVCPFLKGKTMTRAEFFELSNASYSSEIGLNFKGVSVEQLTHFLLQTCKNRHYKVDEITIDSGRMLYLASESIGEKAYYLLTALIKENEGLTQAILRAASDKPHGLNGFSNEIVDSLRHVVNTVQSGQEIGVIKKEQVINIIDSVVQRTSFGGSNGATSVNIEGSVVQHIEFIGNKQKQQEEGRLKLEQEEKKRKHSEEEERAQKEKEEYKHIAKQKETLKSVEKHGGSSFAKLIALVFMLTVLVMGGILFLNQGSPDTIETMEPSVTPNISSVAIQTPEFAPTTTQTTTSSSNLETFTNSIDMEFILIPAGEFDMGSSPHEDWDSNEGPIHHVTISKAFYINKYEITQKQWKEIMGNNLSYFMGDDLPVEQVSWNDVQEFIKKLNEKEGINKYRLPSEAEWEYAARAGTTTLFSFGDEKSELSAYAWYVDNSGRKTHPVGTKNPNPWGLYDMHGNVWEWVQDGAHHDYTNAPTDGSVFTGGYKTQHIYRGGSWIHAASLCMSAKRWSGRPADSTSNLIGFRLLMEV